MPYFCYILECADGTFYTGWTTDPRRRERQHNLGRGARYTATRRPVRMVYLEPVPDHSSALRRERVIKTYSRPRKARMILEKGMEYAEEEGNQELGKNRNQELGDQETGEREQRAEIREP